MPDGAWDLHRRAGGGLQPRWRLTRDGDPLQLDWDQQVRSCTSVATDIAAGRHRWTAAKVDALLAQDRRRSSGRAGGQRHAWSVDERFGREWRRASRASAVDKEALRATLSPSLLFTFHSTELPIPMVITSPDLSAVDITPALEQANVMISADLSVTFKGNTVGTLTPAQIVNCIDVAPGTGADGSKTVPILSAAKMTDIFDAIEPQVTTPGVNATLDVDTETKTLKLVEGSDGEGLDREGTAAALTQSAMSTTNRTVEVVLKPIPPDRTTDEVQAMGIKDLLGDYKTTPYVGTKNRQINVRLATSLCSGVFLAPGEEFNTDQRLGIRDAAHGVGRGSRHSGARPTRKTCPAEGSARCQRPCSMPRWRQGWRSPSASTTPSTSAITPPAATPR